MALKGRWSSYQFQGMWVIRYTLGKFVSTSAIFQEDVTDEVFIQYTKHATKGRALAAIMVERDDPNGSFPNYTEQADFISDVRAMRRKQHVPTQSNPPYLQ